MTPITKMAEVLKALELLNHEIPETQAAATDLLEWANTEERQFMLFECAVLLLAVKPVAILKGAQVLQEMILEALGPVSSAPGQVH